VHHLGTHIQEKMGMSGAMIMICIRRYICLYEECGTGTVCPIFLSCFSSLLVNLAHTQAQHPRPRLKNFGNHAKDPSPTIPRTQNHTSFIIHPSTTILTRPTLSPSPSPSFSWSNPDISNISPTLFSAHSISFFPPFLTLTSHVDIPFP
jgi:hypothetical protein